MNLDRLKYRYWQHTDWHDTNSPLEAVYCNAVDGCDPTIAISDFEFCTGLKDKNGKLIYENDQFYDSNKRLCTVSWHNGAFHNGFGNLLGNFRTDEIEIIGNIHEQAEQKE